MPTVRVTNLFILKKPLLHNVSLADLHPGIKGTEQGKGVPLVALQGLAGGGTVWIVL